MTDDPAETGADPSTDERSATDSDERPESDATANGERERSDSATDSVANGATESDGRAEAGSADERTSENLATRVAEYDEGLGDEVAALQTRASDLESDLATAEERTEELTSQLKRTRADFQNYKKRTEKRREQLKQRATEDLIERLVPVRDNLVRALDQDENADIRDGVESTLSEFDRVLEAENVAPIEPDPGDEVDPTRHEVMLRVESGEPEGAIADVYQPGYEIADKVIREAQVTVSKGDEADGE